MQRITIAKIIPASDKDKPTFITDENGAKFSGFESALAALKKGDVIEAEIEIKGKYNNIKRHSVLVEAPPPAAPPRPPDTIALLEVRARLEVAAIDAVTRLLTMPAGDRFQMPEDIYNAYLDRLELHLCRHSTKPAEPKPAETKEAEKPPAAPVESKPERDVAAIQTVTQLVRAIQEDFNGMSSAEALKTMGLKSWSYLTYEPSQAYEIIRKAVGK